METQTNSQPVAQSTTPVNTSIPVQTPVPVKKGNGWLWGCLIVGIILLVCCGVTVGGFAMLMNTGVEAMKSGVNSTICASDSTLSSAYKNKTTTKFRKEYTEQEFITEIKKINPECSTIKGANVFELVQKGWSINTSTVNNEETVTFAGKLNNKDVEFVLVTDGNELKLDSLTVD